MAIHSVAVLGAGVMGAQIAAHFANAGVPALLLDLTDEAAAAGLKRARGLSPDPFFTPETWRLVETASFEQGWPRLRDADWVIEAIVERLDAKVELLAQVDQARGAHAIVSSNTSGIPIAALAEGRSEGFKRHWLGTHFFNPPRYLRLLEVIPTADTDPAVVERVSRFADERLGKGVVIAKDSPNFIGNHLALFEVTRILAAVAAGSYSIEEVDAITGPAIGRPKSATFRTLDLAGLDILAHVIENLRQRLPAHEAAAFGIPAFVERMLAAGLTGEKAGRGFYQRVKDAEGGSQILVIDPATLEYGPQKPPKLAALAAAEPVTDLGARVAKLFSGSDRVGAFLQGDPGADAGLRRTHRTGRGALPRRRGSRDAMGVRMGARPVRADGRDGHPRGPGRGAPDRTVAARGGRAAAAAARPRRWPQPAARGPGAAGRRGSAGAAVGEGPVAGGEVQPRCEPGGRGRRRAGGGVPLEDERDRRRRARDAAAGRAGGGAELRGAGNRQRRACTSRPAPT